MQHLSVHRPTEAFNLIWAPRATNWLLTFCTLIQYVLGSWHDHFVDHVLVRFGRRFQSLTSAIMTTFAAQDILIDVRTPAEYSTGYLSNAINVEYQNIVPFIVEQQAARKDASITLYCRSGRRSDIAKAELDALGYLNVRDIGSFEAAKIVLENEAKAKTSFSRAALKGDGHAKADREKLKESTNVLLAGLKNLED